MPRYTGVNLVRSKGVSMTNTQQQEDERITLDEMLEIIFVTIHEYKGTTGILRKHDKDE
jgi:hypothetical protein